MMNVLIKAKSPEEMKEQLMKWYKALGGEPFEIIKVGVEKDPTSKGMDSALKERAKWEEYKPTVMLAQTEQGVVAANGVENPHLVTLPDNVKVELPTQQQVPENKSTPGTLPPAAVSGELDAAGMPWDKRIHSTGKSKNLDGTWRYQRGVKDDVIAQIEYENRSKGYGQASPLPQNAQPIAPVVSEPVPFVPPPVPAGPHVEMPKFEQQPVVSNVVELLPKATVTAEPPPPVPQPQQANAIPAHDLASFKSNFSVTLMNLMAAGKIDREWIVQTCAHFKINDIIEVTKDDNKLNELLNNFHNWKFVTRVG